MANAAQLLNESCAEARGRSNALLREERRLFLIGVSNSK